MISRAFVFLLLLLAASTLHAQNRLPQQDGPSSWNTPPRVKVVASGEDGITLEVSGLRARVEGVGDSLRLVNNAEAHVGFVGSRSIAGLVLTVAVPHDAVDFNVVATPTSFDTLKGGLIPSIISDAAAIPLLRSVNPTVQRGLRLLPLLYQPVRVEGGRGIVVSGARIRVTWKGGTKGMKRGGERRESPSLEMVLRNQILNYDAAKRWRSSAPDRAILAGAPWGMERSVVLLAGRDGLYRAEGSELAATGAEGLLGSPIAQLRLRNRDRYLRFHIDDRNGNNTFDGGDAIEFMGRRNPSSEGLYFDAVTDTNAYILSWSGGAGSEPLLTARNGSGAAPALVAYDSTLHFEEENYYFPGLTLSRWEGGDIRTIHVSERVPSERFYWRRITYPQQGFAEFECSPHFSAGAIIKLRVRLAAISDSLHNTLVRLNGNDLGVAAMRGFADTTFEFDVPVSYFMNGKNTLAFVPQAPPGNPGEWKFPDHVMLDYVELAGRWLPDAFGDEVKVRMPTTGGPSRATIVGLTAPAAAAISNDSRIAVDSIQRGFLFRLTSRQFEVAKRNNPGVIAQFGGNTIASPLYAGGMMLIEVDGASGAQVRNNFFNLYTGNPTSNNEGLANALTFLRGVSDGNIILAGFSIGGGEQGELTPELKSEFAKLGSTKVGGNNFVASWVFAARKGKPETAVERYANLGENDRGVSLGAFIPDDDGGTSYRAVVTLEGAAGEEFQANAPFTPGMRYHGSDSLVATSNRADMFIITQPGFMSDAHRLAAHRATHAPAAGSPFAVRVVDVHRIYDEFNDGVKDPVAIRRFLQYADSSWTQPSPAYVLLLGDASWDPQRRLPSSATIDYVPTMGIPATDYLYTVREGDSSMMWQQLIGRLPARSAEDARVMVDKLIEYDGLQPAHWNKRFVFMAGGANRSEVDRHHDENVQFAENYITSGTYLGDTALIWRTSENLALPDDKDADWARGEINKGALWVNFSGHGATDVADLDYGYPEQFDNGNRYFVLATFSCQTGAYAEPEATVRNERFVLYPGKGAIAAIGGTSYSFPHIDVLHKARLFSQITEPPYERVLGAIFINAKYVGYFAPFAGGGWQMALEGYVARNSLLMYTLLGDPSMKLASRSTPELAVTDVSAANQRNGEPAPGDTMLVLRSKLRNFGVPSIADTGIRVIATIINRAQVEERDTVVVYGLERSYDLEFELSLDKEPGEYTIRIEADPLRTVGESYLKDNDTTFTLRVRGNQVQLIEPVPFGRVNGYDNVVIRLLNPPSGRGAEIVVDTTASLDSPARFTSRETGTMQLEELTTTWTFSIPQPLRSARRFWWRAATTAGDTATTNLFPLVETFTVEQANGSEFIASGVEQMARGRMTNLVNEERGVGPGERPVTIAVTGMGQSKGTNNPDRAVPRNFTPVMVDGKDYNRPPYDGINILVLDGTRVLGPRSPFAFYAQGTTADVDRFLKKVNDSIEPGQRILLWTNGGSFIFDYRGDEIKQALKDLGASPSIVDQLGQEDSYALIGGKGMAPADIREAWLAAGPLRQLGQEPPWPVTVYDTVRAPAGAGSLISPVIGPATAWRSATLTSIGNSPVDVTVFGVRRDGLRDTVLEATGAASPVDLSSIDVRQYPRLEMQVDFPNDSTLRLRSMTVDYDPSPEIAIVPSTARLQRDSVLQGDPGIVDATIVNLSRRYAADSVVAHLVQVQDAIRGSLDSLMIVRLAPLDSVRHSFRAATDRMKGDNILSLRVNGGDIPAEAYRQNNTFETALRVGLDDMKPAVTIYADGIRLMQGDYVAPAPEFELRIFDNSKLILNDSTTVQMILDNDIITTREGAIFERVGEGEMRARFRYRPQEPLADGEHAIRVMTVDASGNGDTTEFVYFNVERELHVRNVVNWPNPFANKTTFTFMVSSGTTLKGGEIGIFTVAGRKIKAIKLNPAELNIGFNKVEWDGHDDDGDRLANGVYLYRLIVDDGVSKREVIEKIVVMR